MTTTVQGYQFDCRFEIEPAGDDWPDMYHLISAKYEGIEVLPFLDPAIIHQLEGRFYPLQ